MLTAILASFSLTGWFFTLWSTLVDCFDDMNSIQWGVVSACAVAFGFLCLKGSNANR